MVCVSAGDPDPDIGGPGILTAFIAQSSISLIIAACLILFAKEKQRRKRWVQTALTSPSDTLTVTGIAVCVGGFATHNSISLYHLRMLFDLIGLTTMANVAAIYCVLKYTKEYRKFRVFAALICQAMAIAIAVILCVSVRSWNDNQVGKCYHWFVTDSKWDVSQTTTNLWKVNYSPINRDVTFVAAMAFMGGSALPSLSSQVYRAKTTTPPKEELAKSGTISVGGFSSRENCGRC
ncbi:uncharacterized protein BDR25DRAFT_117356 [Lindgomyces ingoldianus]|uniref:Uncharacterized protein n=1 Tax=Lindgomyces ingoldianus TaxID=673940 RepID=A0ACB6QA14_9PLEO|nr:uncharacterized protein BDR25DRAFT_117356 [Lindgomyces ingoldianus]KAF2462952.1 hypothetical protein BDR25DRAFT_117356 [Lindgomyces ingoldianus]